MRLSERQIKIIEIVKDNEPITSVAIAEKLSLSRAALRSDLAILTMANILRATPNVGYIYVKGSYGPMSRSNISEIKAKDILSLPVVITENTTVYDAIVSLFMEDTGTLFVVDEKNNLVGVVSRKDIIKTIIGKSDINELPVAIIMTRGPNLVTVKEDDPIVDVASKIVLNQIDSIPVVRDSGDGFKVIGKISKTNITKTFVEIFTDDIL